MENGLVELSNPNDTPTPHSFTHPNRLGRLPEVKVVALLLNVDADSEGSKLPALGVMSPPPSILIGMINSRGLFLIG